MTDSTNNPCGSMRCPLPRSLKWKIPLVAGAVIFGAVALCYLELHQWQSREFASLSELEAEAAKTLIRQSFKQEMEAGEPHKALSFLETMLSLESIDFVRIFDPSGTIHMSGNPEERGESVTTVELQAFREGRTLHFEEPEGESSRYVTVVSEVIPLEESCTLCHHIDASSQEIPDPLPEGSAPFWTIENEQGEEIAIAGILSLGTVTSEWLKTRSLESAIVLRDFVIITCVFAISLPLLLWWMVTRRIVALDRIMSRARRGDLDVRATVHAQDEIGNLAESFNELLESLKQARTELEEAHRQTLYHMERLSSVGELAARVAHEIKNPIAGISLGMNLLNRKLSQGGGSGEEIRETVEEINHQIQRLDGVTRNLLNFARFQTSEMKPCRIPEITEHIQQFIGMESGTESFDLRVECEESLPPVMGDPKLLEQALFNLVLNSQQAGATQVRIRACLLNAEEMRHLISNNPLVRIEDYNEGGCTLSVSDNGPGIPEEHLANIWKPFFTTKREGTGLGLAIVRQIMKDHGGDVLLETRVGEGTTVTLLFPLEKQISGGPDNGKKNPGSR